eukprot:TRINITY_DN7553_c0_g1_i1.p1 TRINITY_DN7553_c0_g1~~TRINITY_DN7553_c0_g1_i1.p1  ORF type:complete len:359 (-),score=76.55 TRINITY_DN7553_c0_g1_i1:63-1103(-)
MTSSADVLRQFKEVTGAEDSVANFFLESSGWKLERATAMFYETGGIVPRNTPSSNQPPRSTRNNGVFGFSDMIADDSKAQTHYTGGSKSGMVVADPEKEGGDYVSGILDKIRDKSAATGPPPPQETKKPEVYTGTGYTLGRSPGESATIAAKGSPSSAASSTITLTFYSKGFTINDEPLRLYDDPVNKKFLNEVEQGYVPSELSERAKRQGASLSVNVVDKKTQDYVPPPVVLQPFSGQGRTLGAAVPSSSTTATPTRTAQAIKPFSVDESKPTTLLQIRFHTGKSVRQRFNLTHTTNDIRAFIDSNQGVAARYRLQTPYPVAILEDNKTLQESGLRNAVVVQKLL